MRDKRNEILARQLLDYSIELKKGEVLYLEIKGKETLELGKQIIRLATEKGATTFWYYNDESLLRQWIKNATDEQFKTQAELHLPLMKRADAYIGLRGSDNPFDLADIDSKQMEKQNSLFYKPVHLEERVKRTRWVVLRFPNNAMAQLAETSQEKFEDFYYDVCCADYAKMSKAQDKLFALMDATDKVHIVSPGTDLTFSIKNIPVLKCDGKRNIPDGEVYTAPVRDSVNGTITYNTPSLYQGIVYNNISLTFKKGKIVKATCSGDNDKLNKIFDSDPGARYVGEFAIGVNPFILHPMKDTLFDEKIAGSIHFTPGQCYDEAPNGNDSTIHWDLVLIQRKDYGGGEIYFDDKLIRKDGVFTDPKMEKMFSKENLKAAEVE
ncbi:MAG: aminopeptidase [candidate division Zixibacteria bacterium]|nr:aminopeptidase [candidate division Zixibacteria bacterium]MDD5426261.1 aminopeptidase [candidate division Zixibacteria bacterium]